MTCCSRGGRHGPQGGSGTRRLAAGQVRRGSPCTAVEANFPGLLWLARGKVRTALRFCRESAALLSKATPPGCSPSPSRASPRPRRRPASGTRRAQRSHRWSARTGAQRLRGRVGAGASMERRRELRARVLARDAGALARAHGQDAYALRALHELCRLRDPAAAAPELASLTDEVDGPFVAIAAPHAGRPRRCDHPRASTDLQPSQQRRAVAFLKTSKDPAATNPRRERSRSEPWARAHMIGFRGHFVTKSRGDSTTLVGRRHPRSRPAAGDA
jgi:hypothetical protein